MNGRMAHDYEALRKGQEVAIVSTQRRVGTCTVKTDEGCQTIPIDAVDIGAQALEKYEDRQAKLFAPKKPRASQYTTKYAIEWGKSKGWEPIGREQSTFERGFRRTHDAPLGSDSMMVSDEGLVLIQGAGKGERAVHLQRFIDRGGPDVLKRMKARFYYVEFERGNKNPIREEQW